jgi:Lrp/AsnC family transcriptional regulator, leucine-responsive regulatory protein
MPANRKKPIDPVDSRIIEALVQNARIAVSDLAKEIGMSAPSITERIRRLEAAGIVQGYTVEIDPKALGFTLAAIVRIKPRPGQLHLVERMIQDEPRFLWCDKVTGDDCFIARLCLSSIDELDPLLDPLHERAETSTAIVKSSPVRPRLPPLQDKGRR